MDLGSHLVKPLILGLKVDQCPQGIPEMSLLGQLLKWFKGEHLLTSPLACTSQGKHLSFQLLMRTASKYSHHGVVCYRSV